jgi:hypothetical protein
VTVQGVIAARIDRLPANEKELLPPASLPIFSGLLKTAGYPFQSIRKGTRRGRYADGITQNRRCLPGDGERAIEHLDAQRTEQTNERCGA